MGNNLLRRILGWFDVFDLYRRLAVRLKHPSAHVYGYAMRQADTNASMFCIMADAGADRNKPISDMRGTKREAWMSAYYKMVEQ